MGYCDTDTLCKASGGDMNAVYALYAGNAPMIRKIVYRYSHFDAAVSFDDLMQEAWFAIIEAVRTFDAMRGTWSQALVWALKNQFRRALHLHRKMRPRILSLDQTAPEDDGAALLDCVTDLRECADAETEVEDFRVSVRKVLRKSLPQTTAVIIERHDLGGELLQAVAAEIGLSYVNATAKRRTALLRLRHNRELFELYVDAMEIASATYRQSAENCAMLLLARCKGNAYDGKNDTETQMKI